MSKDGLYLTNAVHETFDMEGGSQLENSQGSGKSKKGRRGKEGPKAKGEGEYYLEGKHEVASKDDPMCLNPDPSEFAAFGKENQEDFEKDVYKTQDGFARKVYGIFSVEVLIMAFWIFYVQLNKESVAALHTNSMYLIIAIVLALGSFIAIIAGMKNIQRKVPVNYILALVNCLAMSFIAGRITFKMNINIVLTSFILTFLITIILFFAAPKIIASFTKRNGHKLSQALGPVFGILGAIVVTVCIIFFAAPFDSSDKAKPSTTSAIVLILVFVLVAVYMTLDTYAIVSGKYQKMISIEDYIYGSTKLFADFVLMFTIIAQVLNE